MERREAESVRELEEGVRQLLDLHVKLSNDNFSVRAPAVRNQQLWHVGNTLNTLIAWLSRLSQDSFLLQREREEARRLADVINASRAGGPLGALASASAWPDATNQNTASTSAAPPMPGALTNQGTSGGQRAPTPRRLGSMRYLASPTTAPPRTGSGAASSLSLACVAPLDQQWVCVAYYIRVDKSGLQIPVIPHGQPTGHTDQTRQTPTVAIVPGWRNRHER